MGAGTEAFAASDAVCAVRVFPDGNAQFTGLLAETAASAFVHVHLIPVKRESVEQAVYCAKGADIPAEGAVEKDGYKQRDDQNAYLPCVEKAYRGSQAFVEQYQRDASLQRAHRTDIFAEPGLADACKVAYEHGKKDHENGQYEISGHAERLFAGKPLQLSDKGYFEQQVLYQAERTQKAADQTAEQGAEYG